MGRSEEYGGKEKMIIIMKGIQKGRSHIPIPKSPPKPITDAIVTLTLA